MTGGAARDEVRMMGGAVFCGTAARDGLRAMFGGEVLITDGTVVDGDRCLIGMGAGC